MRVIKPQHLSLLHRCFERQGRAYLGVAALAYVPIGEAAALLPEQELWQQVAPLMLPEVPLDAVLPKSGAEYLMIGDACAPGGTPVTGLEVELRVGALRKRLNVFGERYWLDKERISDVRPFVRMPLGWAQAWGGPKVAENPLGRGSAPEPTAAGPLVAVPPVQHPEHPSLAPNKPARPASFAPIPPMWPQRKRFDGTYDDAWLKTDFPGPPRDFDWRYHCIGSADQWQAEAFTGSEEIEITHMHPDHPRLSFRLPGIRPAILARMKRAGGTADRLGEPRLTTLWLLPNQLRVVMVWHAMFEVGNEFADDVELLCGAFEWLDRPKPAEHYVEAIAARLDPEHGAEKVLDDFELMPEGLATPNAQMEHFRKSLGSSGVDVTMINEQLAAAQRRVDAEMARVGDDFVARTRQAVRSAVEGLGLPRPPTRVPDDPSGLISAGRSLFASIPRASDLKGMVSAHQTKLREELARELRGQGISEADIARALHPTPPASPVRPRELLAQFDSLISQLNRRPEMRMPPIDPRLRALVDRAESMQSAMTRGVAHMQPPPPPLAREIVARWRDGAQRAREAGQTFARLKLKAADFSGMDLSGVDFSEAELEGANFSGARLVGANFSSACLAHARFDQALLDHALMVGANIGKASLAGASCAGVQFADAIVHGTVMSTGKFPGADLRGVTLLEIEAEGADFSSAELGQSTFIKGKLAGARFAAAKLPRASFIECDLAGAEFVEAHAESADFITCALAGACFDKAVASNARFVYRTALERARFKDAQAPSANFRATPLLEADFSGALLDRCDFTEADCSKANFERASLKGALLMKADLTGARLRHANLMEVVAQHACLHGADLRGVNLYGADLARVEVDTETRLDEAFMAKARTVPRHKARPPGDGGGAA